jgi:hypothetical protein
VTEPEQPAWIEPPWRDVFAFRHVTGVPTCPCADPGNYLRMSQSTIDPLDVLFTCWCGRTIKGRMDSPEELQELLAKNGVT